jgi:hypothetical protein
MGVVLALSAACSVHPAGEMDARPTPGDAAVDSGSVAADSGSPLDAGPMADAGVSCSVDGEPGICLEVSACLAKSYTATPGGCPGSGNLECCAKTPDVADNPPVPSGWMLLPQSEVTSDMTAWAVSILNDPTDYPLFSTALRTFGTQLVMARAEWHPPDEQNAAVHRGVTLYVPTDADAG